MHARQGGRGRAREKVTARRGKPPQSDRTVRQARPEDVGAKRTALGHGPADGDGDDRPGCCGGSSHPLPELGPTHFAYADGTPFVPFGTTVLAWHVQDGAHRARTIRTLERSPFNKVRMSLIPPVEAFDIPAARERAASLPFAARPGGGYDPERYDVEYFAKVESCIEALLTLGIEVELILFPAGLERWGLDRLTPEQEAGYVRYAVARLAAYRNVWWSMADAGGNGCRKEPEEWERLFRTLRECDFGRHPATLHAPPDGCDWGAPWLTHASLRHEDVRLASAYTGYFAKPIAVDDCGREGIGEERRDALTAEELVCRIWEGFARGGCVAHGESLRQPDGRWWSMHGGTLLGESPVRIDFLRSLLEAAPSGLVYNRDRYDASTLERAGEYYLQYFGPHRFTSRAFALPAGEYAADLIDTWNMTITTLDRSFEHRFEIELPGELHYALRLRRIGEGSALSEAAAAAYGMEEQLVEDGD